MFDLVEVRVSHGDSVLYCMLFGLDCATVLYCKISVLLVENSVLFIQNVVLFVKNSMLP